MHAIRSICVYCGSGAGADPAFTETARRLGVHMPVTATVREVLQSHFGLATQQPDPEAYLAKDFAVSGLGCFERDEHAVGRGFGVVLGCVGLLHAFANGFHHADDFVGCAFHAYQPADRPFDAPGARQVRENPDDDPVDGEVLAVDPPRELLHRWGDDQVRWRLQPTASGCRLTLEQRMSQRNPAAMNAAGWDVCLTVLAGALAGDDVQRTVGPDAMAAGWEALRDHYADVLNG